jgi:Tol biopolymer transport system component
MRRPRRSQPSVGSPEPRVSPRRIGVVRTPTILLALLAGLACVVGAGAKDEPLPPLAFASDGAGSLDLFVLPSGATSPRRLASSPLDEFSPSWAPGGGRVAYRVNPKRSDTGDIWVVRSDGRGRRNVTRTPRVAEWSPAWSPDGRLIAYFSWSGMDVWVMRPDGTRPRNVTRSAGLDEYPSWSPDGRRFVFGSHRDGQFEIYVTRLDGSRQVNLTRDQGTDQWPAWSPDGRRVAFMSDRDGSPDVFVMRADGSSPANLTGTPDLEETHPAWLPDGRLSFLRYGETGPIEMWAVDPDGGDEQRLAISAEPVFVYAWKAARR